MNDLNFVGHDPLRLYVTQCVPGVLLMSGDCGLILQQIVPPNYVCYAVREDKEDRYLAKQLAVNYYALKGCSFLRRSDCSDTFSRLSP